MGLTPDGLPPDAPPSAGEGDDGADDEPDFTAKQALMTPAFWMLTISQVSSSVAIVTLALHLAPKLTDPATGMTLTQAGTVELAYTLVALPSQFLSGYFADRLPKTTLIAALMAVQATGILVIALFDSVPDGVSVRAAVRDRLRRTHPADDGDTRGVLRAQGVRHDNGASRSCR